LAFEIIEYPVIVYLLSLGFDITAIGQLTSAGIIVVVVFEIPFGILTDRIGRKNSIMLGLCLYAAVPLSYLACNGYIPFLSVAVLSGIANAFLMPASFAFVGEIVPPQLRATANTIAYFVSGILTFGPFVGVALYVINKTLPFVICSFLTLVTICIFYRYIKPSRDNKNERHKERTRIGHRDLAKMLKRSLIGLSAVNLFYSFGAGILFLLGFLRILNVLGESLIITGLVLIFPQIISLVLSIFVAQWMDETRRKKPFLMLGLLGYGLAALTFALVTGVFETILVWTFLSTMGVIIGASASTWVMGTSEKVTIGTTMSIYSFFGTVGLIISLQLAGYLQEAYMSFQKPFLLVALLCLWAFVITWVVVEEKPVNTKTPQ
jgi:MFS family permease